MCKKTSDLVEDGFPKIESFDQNVLWDPHTEVDDDYDDKDGVYGNKVNGGVDDKMIESVSWDPQIGVDMMIVLARMTKMAMMMMTK